MGEKRALAALSCLPLTPAPQDSSVTRYAVDAPLFVWSLCMQTQSLHSPVFLLWDVSSLLSVLLISPPLSHLSQQKSIPVHSLCQHLPTFPSVWLSSSLGSLYWKQTVSLPISIDYFTALHWTCSWLRAPSVECHWVCLGFLLVLSHVFVWSLSYLSILRLSPDFCE